VETGGFRGTLEGGARISASVRAGEETLDVAISHLQKPEGSTLDLFQLQNNVTRAAAAEGLDSVTITAVDVDNPRLAEALERRGFTKQTRIDYFGRTHTDYIKRIPTEQ
jgi:hypothetical protein